MRLRAEGMYCIGQGAPAGAVKAAITRIRGFGLQQTPNFTDAEAAERLLNRHAREVAQHFDKENLHSAEDLMHMSPAEYLLMIAAPPQEQE